MEKERTGSTVGSGVSLCPHGQFFARIDSRFLFTDGSGPAGGLDSGKPQGSGGGEYLRPIPRLRILGGVS